MSSRKLDVKAGDIYGMLTIINEVEPHEYPSGDTRRKFAAACSCGSGIKEYLISQLRSGGTKSCGCITLSRLTSHGMHKTRQYQCWADMKNRCDCKDNKYYAYYGGRGITYCDKWRTFEGFWEDMQEGYSDNLTLNRIDNDLSYCKENCKWDTISVQNHNRRKRCGTIFSYMGLANSSDGFSINSRIRFKNKQITLGKFTNEVSAAKAYDDASEILYNDRPNKTSFEQDWIYEQVCNVLRNITNAIDNQVVSTYTTPND